MKKLVVLILLLMVVVMMTGCLADADVVRDKQAGFFTGVWHGWIAPFALIINFFNKSVTIYEVNNVGWWYDLGFYIAVIGGFGGINFSRKKYSSRND